MISTGVKRRVQRVQISGSLCIWSPFVISTKGSSGVNKRVVCVWTNLYTGQIRRKTGRNYSFWSLVDYSQYKSLKVLIALDLKI